MKAGLLSIVLAALLPAAARAQEPPKDTLPVQVKKAPVMRIVRLTDRDVNRALPQMSAELSGTMPVDNAVSGMTRTEYVSIKNALMVARLDFLDPARLQLPADDGTLEVRRVNANYYRTHEGALEPVVQRAKAEASCKLCLSQ